MMLSNLHVAYYHVARNFKKQQDDNTPFMEDGRKAKHIALAHIFTIISKKTSEKGGPLECLQAIEMT
jgi:hypothetical protein